MCVCVLEWQSCAKCNKKYRAQTCQLCRGHVSIAKCSTCAVGYCSAKCKKEARAHKCKVATKEQALHEKQYIGGSVHIDMFHPGTKTIIVDNKPVICLTDNVFKFIYGTQTEGFRLVKGTKGLFPAMSEDDVQLACMDAIKLFHANLIAMVGKGEGALLLECSSYIDFAHKIINGARPRWVTDNELVGGGPLIEGPNAESIKRERAGGAVILRVCIQHPDKFNEAGYAQWSYNSCFIMG